MNRTRRGVLLAELIDRMKSNGSWCGETHLQKAIYIAQALAGLKTGYKFILYKHGPFSFDLRDELTALRADEVLFLQPRGSYGPTYETTERACNWKERYPRTLAEYSRGIEFAATAIGDKGVTELERLATALYVRLKQSEQQGGMTVEEAAARITALKPHISVQDADCAVREADRLRAEAPGTTSRKP